MKGKDAYQKLEREIIVGVLKPRERLLENDLSARLAISRTLLREVFRRLDAAGLVSFTPKRGVAVRDFSPQEIEEVYFVRALLERAAAPLILERVTSADLKELRRLNGEFTAACSRLDMPAMILTNLAFHRRLVAISGNGFLCELLKLAQTNTHQVRYIAWVDQRRVAESLQGHENLLRALAKKDLPGYEAAIIRQMEAGKRHYQRIFGVGRLEGSSRTPAKQHVADARAVR